MATTKAMASSSVLLLAAILLAAACVQAQRDSLPPPPTEAPALIPPGGGGGQCTLVGVAQFAVCASLRVRVPGRTSTVARDLCCRQIREKPMDDTVKCLCTIFWPFNVRDRADAAKDVNAVLRICGKPPVPGPVCNIAT